MINLDNWAHNYICKILSYLAYSIIVRVTSQHFYCILLWVRRKLQVIPACNRRGLCKGVGTWGFPGGASGKDHICQGRRCKRLGFYPWAGKIPWRRAWQPIPVFSPGESQGQRSLVGYSPWVTKSWTWLKLLSMCAHMYGYQGWESQGHFRIPMLDL